MDFDLNRLEDQSSNGDTVMIGEIAGNLKERRGMDSSDADSWNHGRDRRSVARERLKRRGPPHDLFGTTSRRIPPTVKVETSIKEELAKNEAPSLD